MNILVIGRGGREHSLVKKFAESEQVDKLYVAPGNAGMEKEAIRVDLSETDHEGLLSFAKEQQIGLTMVGPENPLLDGIVDRFQEEGLVVFGPTKKAALIEGSKKFAKELMKAYNIPTAEYQAFTELDKAKAYLEEKGAPIVVKADGLAAGKGVVVAETVKEAIQAAEDMLEHGQFGEASREIVIEEFLEGEEFSLMAFVQGTNVYPMIPAKDHKRAFEGDQGPNTGGMGAFAPVPFLPEASIVSGVKDILEPAARALADEDRPFTGILYAGLIETEQGPKVIEFNARFGDPETQVVLPLLENDLVQVIWDVLAGKDPQLNWSKHSCAGAVVASSGYPGAYQKEKPVPVLEKEKVFTIHAGTENGKDGYVSSGGRVLLVGAVEEDLPQALETIYEHMQLYTGNKDFYYRRDIGLSSVSLSVLPSMETDRK